MKKIITLCLLTTLISCQTPGDIPSSPFTFYNVKSSKYNGTFECFEIVLNKRLNGKSANLLKTFRRNNDGSVNRITYLIDSKFSGIVAQARFYPNPPKQIDTTIAAFRKYQLINSSFTRELHGYFDSTIKKCVAPDSVSGLSTINPELDS